MTNAEEMWLLNIPLIVASGSSHRRILPVSHDSIATKILGVINPITDNTIQIIFRIAIDFKL